MAKYESKTANDTCVFCDIVAKDDPKALFWQDEKHIAFLSIDPNTPGFSLVVPKTHCVSDIMKMPDNDLKEFIVAAKKVAQILEDFYSDVGRVGLVMEGTGIDHAHIKLVPMHGTEHMKNGEWKQYLSDVEHWFEAYEGWLSSAGGPMVDRDALVELTQKIRKSQTVSPKE